MMRTSLDTGFTIGGLAPPWRTLSLSALALVLYLIAGPAPDALIFDRAAIAGGEWWRLITGQVVHGDAEHAFWDIVVLAFLGTLLESRLGRDTFFALALGTVAINAWLWWGKPDLIRYCGLSGLVNSLIAAGLWRLWRDTRDALILWIGLAAGAKIVLEMIIGEALFTHTAWPSVPEVHAVGFAAGLLATLVRKVPARRYRSDTSTGYLTMHSYCSDPPRRPGRDCRDPDAMGGKPQGWAERLPCGRP